MYRRYKSGRTISGPPPKPIVKLEELLTSAQQEREEAVNAELDKRHAAAVAAARAAGVPPPEDPRANAAAKEDPMASLLALTAKNKSKKRGDGSGDDAGQWLRTGKHGKDASAGTTAKGDTAPSLPDRVPRGKPQQLPVAGKRPQENRDAAEWHAARARELAEALARANAMVVAYRCVTCDLNVVCRTCGYSCHRDHHLQEVTFEERLREQSTVLLCKCALSTTCRRPVCILEEFGEGVHDLDADEQGDARSGPDFDALQLRLENIPVKKPVKLESTILRAADTAVDWKRRKQQEEIRRSVLRRLGLEAFDVSEYMAEEREKQMKAEAEEAARLAAIEEELAKAKEAADAARKVEEDARRAAAQARADAEAAELEAARKAAAAAAAAAAEAEAELDSEEGSGSEYDTGDDEEDGSYVEDQ